MKYLKNQLTLDVTKSATAYDIDENTLKFSLKNKRRSGMIVGCYGHVLLGAACVYIDTEKSQYAPLANLCCVRYAKNEKDFSVAKHTKWVKDSELPEVVIQLLASKKEELDSAEKQSGDQKQDKRLAYKTVYKFKKRPW